MVHLGQKVVVRTKDPLGIRVEAGTVVAIGVHDRVPDRGLVEKGVDPRAIVVEVAHGKEIAVGVWEMGQRITGVEG